MVKTTAVTWANKNIYKDFKCDHCGTKLTKRANGQDELIDAIMVNPEELEAFEKGETNFYACYCPICHQYVAKVTNLELDETEVVNKGGNIVDFMKNRKDKKKVS